MKTIPPVRKFLANEGGNVSIITAIVLLLVLLVIAVAVNTADLVSQKSKMNHAADAAILAAVKEGAQQITSGNVSGWEKQAIIAGQESFELNMVNNKKVNGVSLDFNLELADNGMVRGDLLYRAELTSFLSKIIGQDVLPFSQKVSATNSVDQFARVTFLVDVSQSMGIAADNASQSELRRSIGCAFACHYVGETGEPASLPIARSMGVKLRIDSLKDAIKTIVTEMDNFDAFDTSRFEVGIYGLSNSAIKLLDPTTDKSKIYDAIDDIELTKLIRNGGSNLDQSLEDVKKYITKPGNGYNPRSRISYIVIITDGVENSIEYTLNSSGYPEKIFDRDFVYNAPNYYIDEAEQLQSFNAKSCEGLKRDGHIVMFLNPEYLIPGGSHSRDRFNYIKRNLMPKIIENGKKCGTSENLVFSGETEAEIISAAKTLTQNLFESELRISR